MSIIGIRTQKQEGGVPFENRYFVEAPTLETAQGMAADIVLFEKTIHSVRVEFTKVNLWVLGASPRQFKAVPLSGFGSAAGANPTALELTVELEFATVNSYPAAKYFRVAVDASVTDTRNWGVTYLAAVLDAMETADEYGVWGNLRTKTGGLLEDPVLRTEVAYRQLDKRWYNRKPTTP